MYSNIVRANYQHKPSRVLSGVTNKKGNILGTTIHGLLDNNPQIVNNILDYVDAKDQYDEIIERNKKLHERVFSEIAVNTNNFYTPKKEHPEVPPMIMLMGTGSESGKTFLASGIVGALRERGIHTYVVKVGPDIRDLSPSLYMNKEKLHDYASIKIGNIGWTPLDEVIEKVKGKGYDLVLVEGVMSAATGLLNEKVPYSIGIMQFSNFRFQFMIPCKPDSILDGCQVTIPLFKGHEEYMPEYRKFSDKYGLPSYKISDLSGHEKKRGDKSSMRLSFGGKSEIPVPEALNIIQRLKVHTLSPAGYKLPDA